MLCPTTSRPLVLSEERVLDGVEQVSGWSVDTVTGVVSLDAALCAGRARDRRIGEFAVPVRFDSDRLDVTRDLDRLGSISLILLVEVRR